jgi:CheY-like chemotaxis protein
LVVDDSQSWQNIIEHLLINFGFKTDTALSGKEAISKIREERKKFDAVILDWNMPELDGISTAKELKNIDENIKIIMISAYKESDIENEAKKLDINFFLEKPINPSELNDMLSDLFYGTSKIKEIAINNEESIKQKIQTLRGSKILVAEDNETNQDIILGLLEGSGIEIEIASNGKEAIDKFKSNNNKFELIFMDLQMPIVDGFGATSAIREIDKNIPIIALTANAMKEDIEKSHNAGMNEHLDKPINVEKFYKTLLKYIAKKTDTVYEIKSKNDEDEIYIPELKNINKEYGLKLVLNNKKIYLNILKGLTKYEYLIYGATENNEQFKRDLHTIKGLSASAGALDLNKIAKELDETQDKEKVPKFLEELKNVIEEIKTLQHLFEERNEQLVEIDKQTKERLFLELKEACKTKRAKNTKPIIEELKKYKFSEEDEKNFEKIAELVNKFKFKEALELI